jgi:hypothetical protein
MRFDPALFALGFFKVPAALALTVFEPVDLTGNSTSTIVLALLVVGAIEMALGFVSGQSRC